jgi:hypothetical protein
MVSGWYSFPPDLIDTPALPARAVEPAKAKAQNDRTTNANRFIAGKAYMGWQALFRPDRADFVN